MNKIPQATPSLCSGKKYWKEHHMEMIEEEESLATPQHAAVLGTAAAGPGTETPGPKDRRAVQSLPGIPAGSALNGVWNQRE